MDKRADRLTIFLLFFEGILVLLLIQYLNKSFEETPIHDIANHGIKQSCPISLLHPNQGQKVHKEKSQESYGVKSYFHHGSLMSFISCWDWLRKLYIMNANCKKIIAQKLLLFISKSSRENNIYIKSFCAVSLIEELIHVLTFCKLNYPK